MSVNKTILAQIIAAMGSVVAEGTEQFKTVLSSVSGGGTVSISDGVVTITQVGMLNVLLEASRVSGVAPLAITFDAIQTQISPVFTGVPFNDVLYSWDFGDDIGAYWQYGTKPGLHNKNIANGPVAAHVFETAGVHTVTCTGFYRNSAGTVIAQSKTIEVTVTAADSVFAANTVYVSNTTLPVAGSDNVPVGANCQLVPTWSQITALSSTYKRILLRAGETWVTDGSASLAAGSGIISKYSTGANPVISITANFPALTMYSSHDWRFIDLEITSNLAESQTKYGVVTDSNNTLLLRCNIHNVQGGVSTSVNANGFYIVDSRIEDMFSAPVEEGSHGGPCLFMDVTDRIALLGSLFARSRASHITRLQGTSKTVVSNCTYITASGFNYNSLTIRGKTTDNGNPSVWNGLWSEYIVVSDNSLDATAGGIYVVHSGPQSTGHAERVRNMVVERNYVLGGALDAFQFSVTNLTMRHNIGSVLYSSALSIGAGNVSGVPSPSNNYIYNNTFVKRNTTLNPYFSAININGGGQVNIIVTNNLAYAPGATQNATQSGSPSFINAYGGSTSGNYTLENNTSDVQLTGTNPFGVIMPSNASEFAPTGYALNTGAYVPTFKDYTNSDISGARDKGAVQA